MAWLTVAVATSVFGVFILLLIYSYLYYFERKSYFGLWTLSWAAYLAGQVLSLIQVFIGESKIIDISSMIVLVLNCFLLLYGNNAFIGKPIKRHWVYFSMAAVLWSFLGTILNLTFQLRTFPILFFSSIVYIIIGHKIICEWKTGYFGTRLLGWLFIIWGLHKIDYPFLRKIDWIAPWGYSFGALLAIIICANIIIFYLENTRNELKKSEEHFRLFVENAKDILYHFEIVPSLRLKYISPVITSILGYTPEEFYEDTDLISKVADTEDKFSLTRVYSDKADFDGIFIMRWNSKNGKKVWMEHHNTAIYKDNKLVAIEGIARDITERRNMEEKLSFLNKHDSLTGLYNRNHFEKEFSNIFKTPGNIAALIMCDIDGLKLVNDTFGHEHGDLLLLAASKIISQSLDKHSMAARIGGDEFAVILYEASVEDIERFIQKVRNMVVEYNKENPRLYLSISMGYALDDTGSSDILSVFKKADNNLSRNKLLQGRSARNSIVKTLIKALEARDLVTENHSDRLKDIVENIAAAVGLSESSLNDLRLLAQFHDIGKVGIPDRILFKPGRLTDEEFEEMKSHSEIGWRIAQSSLELQPISDWILKHHEWWNGNGYPFGLIGEDIPVECRILTIADAYDAMTNDRPYRQALSHQTAVEELKRCSGTQFDPNLVQIAIDVLNH